MAAPERRAHELEKDKILVAGLRAASGRAKVEAPAKRAQAKREGAHEEPPQVIIK